MRLTADFARGALGWGGPEPEVTKRQPYHIGPRSYGIWACELISANHVYLARDRSLPSRRIKNFGTDGFNPLDLSIAEPSLSTHHFRLLCTLQRALCIAFTLELDYSRIHCNTSRCMQIPALAALRCWPSVQTLPRLCREKPGDKNIVTSVQGGDTWTHMSSSAQLAYSPASPISWPVSRPELARCPDKGKDWEDLQRWQVAGMMVCQPAGDQSRRLVGAMALDQRPQSGAHVRSHRI